MKEDDFYKPLEQFADIRILRYRVEGFEELPLPTKKLIYYLYGKSVQVQFLDNQALH